MDSDSIFAQPAQPTGMYENIGAPVDSPSGEATAPDKAEAAPAAANPFETGTTAAPAPAPAADGPEEAARDAEVIIEMDGKHLQAEAIVRTPEGAGSPLTREILMAAIEKAGIVSGLDENALAYLLKPAYEERVMIARGTPAENGKDGECRELFEREPVPKPVEREDGTINHRVLGLIREVRPGTPICEITPPTEGVYGTTVLGQEMKPLPGKKAVPLVGEGTQLSSDGSRVEATLSGNLVFRSGRFHVDTVYRVQDIDYDIGNIDFSGDVQVNGEMQDGFEIHAGGNVTLQGTVGNVVIVAGGDINIEKGANGKGNARLETAKTLTTGFIENCTIIAGEKVVASSIINSTVECEGDIEVTKGHGLICGGKITAFGSVQAKVVGNEFSTLTVVTLGVTPRLLAERKKISDQLADVTHHIEEMAKNTAYIESKVAAGKPVPEDRVQMLKRSKIQLPITEKKKEQLTQKLEELDGILSDANASTLTAKTIYPPTKVNIGKYSGSLSEIANNCKVFKDGNTVVFGKP